MAAAEASRGSPAHHLGIAPHAAGMRPSNRDLDEGARRRAFTTPADHGAIAPHRAGIIRLDEGARRRRYWGVAPSPAGDGAIAPQPAVTSILSSDLGEGTRGR